MTVVGIDGERDDREHEQDEHEREDRPGKRARATAVDVLHELAPKGHPVPAAEAIRRESVRSDVHAANLGSAPERTLRAS
jgi:hypothetical protein